jgi:hypothetical protein
VDHEWIERSSRAFDDSFLSLNEVENIDCLQRIVRRRTRKPFPARFNELQFLKSGALLAPTGALSNWFNPIDQILPDPFCVAVPNDVCQAVFEMNRSWQTVQPEPVPIPQLKRENIWSRAYLKSHAVSAQAMDCASRYQEMVMLSGQEANGSREKCKLHRVRTHNLTL